MENILLIHNPAHVYYHDYPFFLSKLTKEGKLSQLQQKLFAPFGSRPRRHDASALLSAKKKAEPAIVATTTLAMTQLLGRDISSQRVNVRQTLLDIRLVCRKNETHPSPPQRDHVLPTLAICTAESMQNDKNTLKTNPTVENRLHIHRTGCAERPLFLLPGFLSNIGSAPIQCLSSRSVSA